MTTKALTGLVAEWFTPEDQVGDESPTRYKLKPLNGLDFMAVAQHGTVDDEGSFTPNHKGRLLLLTHGLKDWENVIDDKGEPLGFNLARIKFIPTTHLVEISNDLLLKSALGAQAEKNSESQ